MPACFCYAIDMSDDKPKRRSFRPTPAWLIYGLLVVEGLLWLSDQFQWFFFDKHRQWTILVAVALAGAWLLLLLIWFVANVLLRRPFQFGIRALLILAVAVAVPCAWIATKVQRAKRQSEAVETIEKLGGEVVWSQSMGPLWLRRILGDNYFQWINEVRLDGTKVTDAGLSVLKDLSQVPALTLVGCKLVTDSGLETFASLDKLIWLDLSLTNITDDGLAHLRGLKKLQGLELNLTQVTDGGLKNLSGLDELQSLGLIKTNVTDAGLKYLRALKGHRELHLAKTKVTDAGLANLEGLRQLRVLNLIQTEVTAWGVKKLEDDLPNCDIKR